MAAAHSDRASWRARSHMRLSREPWCAQVGMHQRDARVAQASASAMPNSNERQRSAAATSDLQRSVRRPAAAWRSKGSAALAACAPQAQLRIREPSVEHTARWSIIRPSGIASARQAASPRPSRAPSRSAATPRPPSRGRCQAERARPPGCTSKCARSAPSARAMRARVGASCRAPATRRARSVGRAARALGGVSRTASAAAAPRGAHRRTWWSARRRARSASARRRRRAPWDDLPRVVRAAAAHAPPSRARDTRPRRRGGDRHRGRTRALAL